VVAVQLLVTVLATQLVGPEEMEGFVLSGVRDVRFLRTQLNLTNL
jgi:hypothetical protein